jgi:two-component system, NtrC family, response regulator AtoC
MRRRVEPEAVPEGWIPESASSQPVLEEPDMRRLYAQASRIARLRIPVLIEGETGVGKEYLAEFIHASSGRGMHPFVRINCAAIQAGLFESEFFGHERGAFTGAERRKAGWFELAGDGTVFLDEVGEIPLALQAKLLRALESRAAAPVGGTELRPIRARFVAASNLDLVQAVQQQRFRRDLFHRIAGVRLLIPPLRARPGEILPLAGSFIARACNELELTEPVVLTSDAQRALLRHTWPGNIRELRNVIERAVALAEDQVITAAHLDLSPDATPAPEPGDACSAPLQLHGLPADYPLRSARTRLRGIDARSILSALAGCGGNQTLAAARLGMARRTLCRWLDRLELPRPRKRF